MTAVNIVDTGENKSNRTDHLKRGFEADSGVW